MSLAEGTALLERRTRYVRLALAAFMVAAGMTVFVDLVDATVGIDQYLVASGAMPGAALAAYGVIVATYFSYIGLLLVSAVLVGMWIFRAHANVNESTMDGTSYSPGWAVGWFFVPIANLVQPYLAMRELWQASVGALGEGSGGGASIVGYWWAAWVFGNVVSSIVYRLAPADLDGPISYIGLVATISLCVAAWCLRRITSEIAQAQVSILHVSDVFG